MAGRCPRARRSRSGTSKPEIAPLRFSGPLVWSSDPAMACRAQASWALRSPRLCASRHFYGSPYPGLDLSRRHLPHPDLAIRRTSLNVTIPAWPYGGLPQRTRRSWLTGVAIPASFLLFSLPCRSMVHISTILRALAHSPGGSQRTAPSSCQFISRWTPATVSRRFSKA